MSYCLAQKYKRKICLCIDPQYFFLMLAQIVTACIHVYGSRIPVKDMASEE